jgi:S-adenosylmethionine hydrolase
VVAHLSRGLIPSNFGETVTSLTMLPLSQPYRVADGTLVGHIIHIDGFGNLISSIKRQDLPPPPLAIEARGQIIPRLSMTYAEGKGLTALIGSSGYLEIALKDGNAAARLNAEIGSEVKIIHQDRI